MKRADKLWYQFAECITKIQSPEMFLGVARILKVKLVDENGEAKDFGILYEEVMNAFEESSTRRKKELVDILKQAVSA